MQGNQTATQQQPPSGPSKPFRGSIFAGAAAIKNVEARDAAAFSRELDRNSYKQACRDDLGNVEPMPNPTNEYKKLFRACRGELLVAETWKCLRKIAFGSTSVVYLAYSLDYERDAAVKVCSFSKGDASLAREFQMYKLLKNGPGIPRVYWFGQEYDRHFLVMELLGPSLMDLLRYCNGRFSLKTVCMLGVQMFEILDWIHKSGYIHRELKPQNICLGHGPASRRMFFVDFGTAIKFRPKVLVKGDLFIPRVVGTRLKGQALFDSIGAHYGNERSYRDDLESSLYMLAYFLLGDLPWQGITALSSRSAANGEEPKTVFEKICDLKLAATFLQRLPAEFQAAFDHLRSLPHEQQPDYGLLIHLFLSMLRNEKVLFDYDYDWLSGQQHQDMAYHAQKKKQILASLMSPEVRRSLSIQAHYDPFLKSGRSFDDFVLEPVQENKDEIEPARASVIEVI